MADDAPKTRSADEGSTIFTEVRRFVSVSVFSRIYACVRACVRAVCEVWVSRPVEQLTPTEGRGDITHTSSTPSISKKSTLHSELSRLVRLRVGDL
jgi:hypothetical protein